MMTSTSQHQSMKRAFLFAPLGDHDADLVSRLQTETGMSCAQVKHWFMVMRKRMNVKKFLGNSLDDDITTSDAAVTDEIKQSGKTPLDILVDFSNLNIQATNNARNIGDDTYNEDDSGNFDEEEIVKEVYTEEQNQNNVVEEKNKSPIKIKQEPLSDHELGGWSQKQPLPEVGIIKEEKLSVEEKAKKYDHLKLEMESLEKQMEEMRKRLEAQKPSPVEANIKQEPGVQQLSQQQPFQFQQHQIVNPWQQQHIQAQYPSYPYQYPAQPYIMSFHPQQQQQYNFQPQQLIPQYHQPQGVVLQYQAVQGQVMQQQLQSNSVQVKSEPLGTNNDPQEAIKIKPKKLRQPLKPKNCNT